MPKSSRGYNFGLTYGSFNSVRALADATGPIGKSKKFFYRAIAGYENSGTLQDFVRNQNFYFNPSLTFRPSNKTDITLTASHYKNNSKGGGWYNRGILAPKGDYNALPINWTHHEKNDKTHDIITNIQLLAQHKITNNLSINLLSRYNYYDYLQQYHHVRWNSYDTITQTIRREFRDFNDVYKESYNNVYASYLLKTGSVKQLILVGYDFGYQDRGYNYYSSRAGVPGLNVFNPELKNRSSLIRSILSGQICLMNQRNLLRNSQA